MKIILASTSPRRRDILEDFDVDFEIITNDIEEIIRKDERPEKIVMSLAFQKAYAVAKDYEDRVVLGADTIVYVDDEIIGKPKDELDAYRILKKLSGREHRVLTGISLIRVNDNTKIVDYEETLVKFRDLDDEKIKNYIATGEAMGKAGAYGIQGYGGILVEGIKGSYNNVIGLPITKLDKLLEEYFDFTIL